MIGNRGRPGAAPSPSGSGPPACPSFSFLDYPVVGETVSSSNISCELQTVVQDVISGEKRTENTASVSFCLD